MEAFAVLLLVVFVAGVSSYPGGPPLSTCTSLTPGHAASTNNQDPPPYQITVNSVMYAPGDDITVTIEQTSMQNEFRGFIIQARRKSGDMDTPIGTFKDQPAETQLLTCTQEGSTWAHSARTDKTSVTATWTAPSSDEGTLAFRATIVVENASGGTSTYYENIMSEDLTYNGPTMAPGMMTTGPTMAPGMMTTDDDDDNNGGGQGNMLQASLLLTMVTLLMMTLLTGRR